MSDFHEIFIEIEQKGKAKVLVSSKATGNGGENGAYFIHINGQKKWIFKPQDEEKPGIFAGIHAGQGAIREQLAYTLQRGSETIYSIPETYLIEIEGQIGSLQRMIGNAMSLLSLQTEAEGAKELSKFPTLQLQGSLFFDLLHHNSDRHSGNLLYTKNERTGYSLHMIDQGGCFSASSEDDLKIEQLHLPQMEEPWSEEIKKEALSLSQESVKEKSRIMKEYGIDKLAVNRMKNASKVIREAFSKSEENGGSSITPYDLGLVFQKSNSHLWDSDKTDRLTSFMKEIVEEKKKFLSLGTGATKAKLLLTRRNYAKTQPDPLFVKLLYGNAPNEEQDIVMSSSIIGKLLK